MAFLAVYGHVNVDHILRVPAIPGPETTLPVDQSLVRLGGTGGNLARAAAALGVPTALAGFVGDDFPPGFRAQLESSGIDLTDLRTVHGSTPRIWILSDPQGRHAAIIDQGVMADGLARPRLDLAWLGADWVHFTTGNPREWIAIASEARKASKRIVVDPAQELAYRYPGRLLESLLEDCKLFLVNEPELARALDLLGYGDPVQLLDHAERLIVTRGAAGVRLYHGKERIEVPACPLRNPDRHDAVGAGDVFRAGLYAGLFRDETWPLALRAGVVAASLFLETNGERFPLWDAVAERRREWNG